MSCFVGKDTTAENLDGRAAAKLSGHMIQHVLALCPTRELAYYSYIRFAKFLFGRIDAWIQAAGKGVDWKPSPDD